VEVGSFGRIGTVEGLGDSGRIGRMLSPLKNVSLQLHVQYVR
jgi:hypothetical protein